MLGSLTFQASFPPELGNFLNGEIDGDCTSPVPGVFVATHARGQRRLTAGVISLQGFAGPVDMVVCKFHHVPGNPPVTADFALTIVDATDVDGTDHTSDVKLRVAVR